MCCVLQQNIQSSYRAGRGQSLSQINPQWLSLTPEEQLQRITVKASQLEACKVNFLTPFQHQRVIAKLANFEEERQELLEEYRELHLFNTNEEGEDMQ